MNELFQKIHKTLPVYKLDAAEGIILYTPGYFIKINSIPIDELNQWLENPELLNAGREKNAISNLLTKASQVSDDWEYLKKSPFDPECLTIHVGHDCNFNCSYCFAKKEETQNWRINGFPSIDEIEQLSRIIAKNARENSGRFTVVYHGSGEPTFHWNRLVDAHDKLILIAKEYKVGVFSYISTNGCLSGSQIDWLAENIDLIGISCDGPSDIQNDQRSNLNNFYLPIDQVCQRILEKKGNFEIRVTVTRESIARLSEITAYLMETCKAKNIRIEPIYLEDENVFTENDADIFFTNYILARQLADNSGVNLSYAGVRLDELHSTYCDILRHTLRLTPDHVTRNCFCFMFDHKDFITGYFQKGLKSFNISSEIDKIKERAINIPKECHDCINELHCSRGCPDFCIFENAFNEKKKLNLFRCRLHKLITVHTIRELAAEE